MTRHVTVGNDTVFGTGSLGLIAGPCVIEDRDTCLAIAEHLVGVKDRLGIPVVFKASFDKANRTSISSYRGPGLDEGLAVLDSVRDETGLPVLSDVHETAQVSAAAEVLDILQIPAFLCRQTDLITACARSGKPVNIKKGQFLAPEDMVHVVRKAEDAGATGVLVTERGTSFGYNRLVTDFRSLPTLRSFDWPVVFDGTHSVQEPGGAGSASGGRRDMIPTLCRAAAAVGCDAFFLETHPNPDHARSGGPNTLPLQDMEPLLTTLLAIHQAAQ
jgi:2-dehydro-3-deoxyphosphooctonate aldolase (KDO 8-P synthase)